VFFLCIPSRRRCVKESVAGVRFSVALESNADVNPPRGSFERNESFSTLLVVEVSAVCSSAAARLRIHLKSEGKGINKYISLL